MKILNRSAPPEGNTNGHMVPFLNFLTFFYKLSSPHHCRRAFLGQITTAAIDAAAASVP